MSEAKIRAGKFCAFRERSPHEVLEKLNSYGLKPEEADAVLNELIDLKYIDEQRFANAYCHDKFYFQNRICPI
ncbi:MAG: RecX family transcriptional regulator [Bacteroidota bacterium]